MLNIVAIPRFPFAKFPARSPAQPVTGISGRQILFKLKMSDSESSGSSKPCKLPCSKTLRAWATSRFEQWLRSDSLEWQQQKTRFSSQQIVAWFAFKDKKFEETVKSLQATGAESTIDRTLFGCCKKYHRDTEFISIFKTPNVKRTVKKNKRYISTNCDLFF